MSEYSLIFDFNCPDWFYNDLNVKFGEEAFANDQSLIIASQCSANIDECFDETTHRLIPSSMSILTEEDIMLAWNDNSDGSKSISVDEDIEYAITGTQMIQGLFFVSSNDTLIGYCIYDNPVKVTNLFKIEEGTILWNVNKGGYHG